MVIAGCRLVFWNGPRHPCEAKSVTGERLPRVSNRQLAIGNVFNRQ